MSIQGEVLHRGISNTYIIESSVHMLTKQYNIGSIWNIPFRVTRLWFIVFIFFTYTLSQPPVIDQYVTIVEPFSPTPIETPLFETISAEIIFSMALVLCLYASVTLHELGHIYGAQKHNVPVEGITLWVLGGAAKIKEQPENPRAEFELTIAGPIVSLILGVAGFLTALLVTPLNITSLTAFFLLLGLLNMGMLILNLIPAFPLDGGRLLRAALTKLYGFERGTQYATYTGKTIAIFIAFTSIIGFHIFGIVLSAFVYLAAHSESKRVEHTSLFSPSGADNITIRDNTFVFENELPNMSLKEAGEQVTIHGGSVHLHTTDETDYLVVTESDIHMYDKLAKHHDTKIITPKQMAECLSQQHPPRSRLGNRTRLDIAKKSPQQPPPETNDYDTRQTNLDEKNE